MSNKLILFVKYKSQPSLELCKLLKSKKQELSKTYTIKVINFDTLPNNTKKQIITNIKKIPTLIIDNIHYTGYNEIRSIINNITLPISIVSSSSTKKKPTEDLIKEIMDDQESSAYGEGVYENKLNKNNKLNENQYNDDQLSEEEIPYNVIENYVLNSLKS